MTDEFDSDCLNVSIIEENGYIKIAYTKWQAVLDKYNGKTNSFRTHYLLWRLANCAHLNGDGKQALYYATRVVSLAEKNFGTAAMEYAHAVNFLAFIYIKADNLKEANVHSDTSMSIMEKQLDKESDLYLDLYGRILVTQAEIAKKQKDFEKELPLRIQAVVIAQKFDPINYVTIISDMATCCEELHRPNDARLAHEKALEVSMTLTGLGRIEYAKALVRCANFYANLKMFTKAISLQEEAIRVCAKIQDCSDLMLIKNQHLLGKFWRYAASLWCSRTLYSTELTMRSLDRWYKDEVTEESVCGEDTRFRFCANCDKVIDRLPLVARDTDFIVCGNCHNVAYCSEECHNVFWLTHGPQCGKPVTRSKFVNYKAKDRCNHCLCAGATSQCVACKTVRYCDAQCQKADWKEHKLKCSKKSDKKK